MNGLIGHIGVLIGLLGALVGIAFLTTGLVRHQPQLVRRARPYAYLVLIGAGVAVLGMERALITHDFTLAFVAGNNSRETPLLFSITGLWSALQGSILLWATILGAYIALFVRRATHRLDEDPAPAVALVVALIAAAFFFALMVGPADPFRATVGAIPVDGAGPNALLQDNLLDAVHPVFLYLGFVGFTIPFALAIGSLVTGRMENEWLSESRRFTVYAFSFLSAGVVLGAWWSYDTFGWGGYWGWDPVENAALLPWLTATAYLHSAMVEERRGLLRIWNISLLIATYALTILGTFLTRSGVVESVHAFSDSGIGPALIGYFAAIVVVGVGLIGWRGDRLRTPGGIDAPVSREGAFLVNNLIFVGIALVVLVGTVFPLFYESLEGQQISIGRPYFDSFTVPLGIALLFFMAVAPALPWRKASSGVMRHRLAAPAWVGGATVVVLVLVGIRGLTPLVAFGLGSFAATSAVRQLVLAALTARRHGLSAWRGVFGRANGGMIVHVGIVVIAVGLTAASSFAHESELKIPAGGTRHFAGHTVTFQRWRTYALPNERGTEAVIVLDGRVVTPRLGAFDGSTTGTSTPAIASTPFVDVYLALISVPPKATSSQTPVDLDIFVQPLIAWLWAGGALVVAGGLLAAAPGRRRRPTDPASMPLPELSGARRRLRRTVSAPGRLGRHRVLITAASVGVLAVVLIAVLASRSVQPGTVESSSLGGKPAPAINGTNIRNGKPVSLAALRGRYVIVNFFASWCQPCETETRPLVAFLFAHRATHNVAILGVTFSDSAANARAFLSSTGASWPAVNDPNGSIAVRYGVRNPPESVVVGPDGRVIGTILGGATEAALDEVVPSGAAGGS